MPDQSAEATLKYILDSGISAVELMGGPVESFAGIPRAEARAAAAAAAARRRRRRPRTRRGAAEIPPGAKTGKWNGVDAA